jgi:hypothetical protein
MPHLIMRLIARQADIDHIAACVGRLHGVRRIEQVEDLSPQMGRQNPASESRPADAHPTLHSLDIHVAESAQMNAIRHAAEDAASQRHITAEFIEA